MIIVAGGMAAAGISRGVGRIRGGFPVKPVDFGIMFLALAVVGVSFFYANVAAAADQGGFTVKAESGRWIFPADAAETVIAPGPLGDTVIEIRDGAGRVLSSPCPNQNCVAAGAIHLRGQWVACLPNKVMLYIDENGGGEKSGGRDSAGETGGDVDVDAAVW